MSKTYCVRAHLQDDCADFSVCQYLKHRCSDACDEDNEIFYKEVNSKPKFCCSQDCCSLNTILLNDSIYIPVAQSECTEGFPRAEILCVKNLGGSVICEDDKKWTKKMEDIALGGSNGEV